MQMIEEREEVRRSDAADLETALRDARDALAHLRTVQARHREDMTMGAMQAMGWVLSDESILENHLRLLAHHLDVIA